jgi:L-threonylcarbamoyladenylate synthase
MKARIESNLAAARAILEKGDLVAIPTETVYGLAANAFHADSVVRIFETKNRPHFDPLIVHVASIDRVRDVVAELPPLALTLMKTFWPGPLTIVLRKSNRIPDIVTSGLDTVGVRMPDHPLTLELLRSLDFPLAAPSANPFGYISPTTALHVAEQLGDRISYIVDGGTCAVGVESTIIDCTGKTPTVLRLGGTTVEQISEAIGPVEVNTVSTSAPLAPGMTLSHYAPRKPMHAGNITDLLRETEGEVSVLSFQDPYPNHRNIRLSETGDLNEAARNLFSAMRILDSDPSNTIIAEWVPNVGLGRAINDRLRRAASQAKS